jgi:hypothetical protein
VITCSATTKKGTQCGGPAGQNGFCYTHDPEITDDERRDARASGGRNRAALARVANNLPPHFARVYTLLVSAMEAVADGTGEPQRLTALATGARAIVSLVEVGELAGRLEQMEATLAEVQRHDAERA